MNKYLIQLIDADGAIVDARTYRTEAAFEAAKVSDWATLYGTTVRCWDITEVLQPRRID